MSSRLRSAALALLLALAGCGGEGGVLELAMLGQPGPWPWCSRLIGFDGRLWFANSSLGVQHNSADVYSYDPRSGALRYERQLFSQAAGRPAVAGGRLYWPHDDSRFHVELGHYSVTDGVRWALHALPEPPILHLSAFLADGERLVAAAAHAHPILLASDDGGTTWQTRVAERRGAPGNARLVRAALLDGRVFADFTLDLRRREGRRLVQERDGALASVPGWPADRQILALERFGPFLWAVLEELGGRGVWRTDGTHTERIGEGPPCARLRDLTTDGDALWALCGEADGGSVWLSHDARRWQPHARLSGGWPHELHLFEGAPYVGGRAADARGALWGPPPTPERGPQRTGAVPRPLTPPPEPPDASDPAWVRVRAELVAALADPASYADDARPLRDRVLAVARAGPPPELLAGLLDAPVPAGPAGPSGIAAGSRRETAHWLLLWGTALSGGRGVPPQLLSGPWREAPREEEKYVNATLGALAAVGGGGQRDPATLEALVTRLGAPGDPDWLQGDVVGALSAATGQPFGYDPEAWRRWWRSHAGSDVGASRGRAPDAPVP